MSTEAKILQHDKTIAVFYPCTQKEYESGSLFKSLDLLVSTSPSIYFSFDLSTLTIFSTVAACFDKYLK